MVPTMPVNKKLKLLDAWEMCKSVPTKNTNRGVSKIPPTPTVPINVPLINPIRIIFKINGKSNSVFWRLYPMAFEGDALT